jgi:hypothetical protein
MARRLLTSRDIAIDTNVLSVLLCYYRLEFGHLGGPQRERQLQNVLRRPLPLEQFESLWNFFGSDRRRIVTQNVVAEAFTNRMRQGDWSRGIGLLREYGLEERECCIAYLYARGEFRRMIDEIGPTDAGLIYIAEVEKATIISEDGRLRPWAGVRSVPF